jgi:tripartite-type tricarboxylate transporter receptor subunit TctC
MRSRLLDVGKVVFVCVVLVIGLLPVAGRTPAIGQEASFPSKPIELIVPFGAGGPLDTGSRIFGDLLSKELNTPVVVSPRPGGGGLIAATAYMNLKPDGHTVLATSPGAIIPTIILSKNPPFDPKKDLVPICYVAETPVALLVRHDSPHKSVQDLIQYGKSNPGKLIGGTSAPGTETDVDFHGLLLDTKIESKRVPYAQGAQLKPALLGGHIHWMTASYQSVLPFLGEPPQMRVLLLTSKVPELPEVPVGPDIGLPNFSIGIWLGFYIHAKTPKPIYDKLAAATAKVSKDPSLPKRFSDAGLVYGYKNAQETSKLLDRDWETFARVIKVTGMADKGKK